MKHTLFLLTLLLQTVFFSHAQMAVNNTFNTALTANSTNPAAASPVAITLPLAVAPLVNHHSAQPIANPALSSVRAGALPCRNSFVQGLEQMGGTAPGIFDGPTGTFFATGLLADSTIIIKADTSGNILWIRKFLLHTGFYQIRDLKVDKTTGDLFAIAYKQGPAYQSIIFKSNPTATTFSWIKRKTNVAYTQLHIVNVNDFIVTGTNSSGRTQLEKRNKVTGSISAYNREGEEGDYYSTLDNGNLYGTSRRFYNVSSDFRASVFSHDANTGNLQWQNAIISSAISPAQTRMYPVAPAVDNPSQALAILSSGDLVGFNTYLTGPVELVAAQTSQTGNVTWTMQYTISNNDRPNAVAIKNTSTGYYMVASLYLTALNNFGYTVVIKTNKQGMIQWARRLGVSGRNIATTAMEKNGSLYLSLASDSYSANELMLVKLDQFGNSSNPCAYIEPITVTEASMQNKQDTRIYTVTTRTLTETSISTSSLPVSPDPKLYCETACDEEIMKVIGIQNKLTASQSTLALNPNPTNNMVTLVMGTAPTAKASISITDQYGKMVYQGILPAGTKRLNLQVGHLPAAIYTVTVYTADKKLATAKLMKL